MEFRVSSLNVNSLIEHRRRFLLNDFISRSPSHVFLLQETKFGDHHCFTHSSYSSFYSHNRPGCGGVAMLIHQRFRVRNILRLCGPIDAIFADVFLDNAWVTFGSVYVHPKCSDLLPLSRILLGRGHFFVGGDFNARHVRFGDFSPNALGVLLGSLIDNTGIHVLSPPTPTCFRSANGSFIDKFITDPLPLFSYSPISLLPSFSDHSGIGISLHVGACGIDTRNGFLLRQFSFANVAGMNRYLEFELASLNLPLHSGLLPGDLEFVAGRVADVFSRAADRYVPVSFVRVDSAILSGATLSIRRSLRREQRRLHRFVRDGLPFPAVSTVRNNVFLFRQMLLDSIRVDLCSHYRRAMADTTSIRHAYRTVITHTGYRKRSKCPDVIYSDDSKSHGLSGSAQIADGFCRHFAANHRLTVDNASPMDLPVGRFVESLRSADFFIPFSTTLSPSISDHVRLNEINSSLPHSQVGILTSAEEVAGVIHRVAPKKSTGPDGMPYYLFKHFSPRIILFLTVLFNHLLSRSHFPSAWKHSIVTPIPKPGRDPSVISNWRPISNLSCVSKIFERIIAERLLSHIGTLNIFGTQFGFLRGLSTNHALGQLQSAIDAGLNCGHFTTLVSLDLRAAFDTVWHDGVVYKMGTLGFSSFLSKLILSFLSGRTFSVRHGSHVSSAEPMPSGTPQGSVCSPILFNLFMSDIPIDDFVKTIQYADDTSLHCTSDSPGRVQNALNLHLIRLSRFFSRWKLLLNENKTELVIFLGFAREASRSLRRRFQNLSISINGFLLRPKARLRFLGLIMNRNNRFVHHVDHALAKARKSYFALRPMFRSQLIDPVVKCNLYKIYVRPVITYASAIWARPVSLSSHQMERLRSFERMVLRQAANVRRNIGSFRYLNSSALHAVSGCPRVDRFIVEKAVGFFQRCHESASPKIHSLTRPCGGRVFSDLSHVWRLSGNGELYSNGNLLLFHGAYSDANRLVYNINQ